MISNDRAVLNAEPEVIAERSQAEYARENRLIVSEFRKCTYVKCDSGNKMLGLNRFGPDFV